MQYSRLVSRLIPVILLAIVLVGCGEGESVKTYTPPSYTITPKPSPRYEYTNPETGQTIYGDKPIPIPETHTRVNSISGTYMGRIGPYVEVITFSGSRATIQGPIQVDICEYKI